MSGGSFNYLCYKDNEDLLSSSVLEDLASMVEALYVEGFDVEARETQCVIGRIEYIKQVIEGIGSDEIRKVWKAMEWFRSCDWSKSMVVRASQEFRATINQDGGGI